MARVQNTLIGKSSGSVGGATFSTWKGINVLKSKAISVANPQTVPQQTQRNRMSIMVAFYRLVSALVAVGYKTQAVGQSAYNAFVSDNIIAGTLAVAPPVATLNEDSISMAKGTIGAIPVTAVTGTNASANVPVTWNPALEPVGSDPTDIAYAGVYNITQGNFGYIGTQARSTGTTTVVMPTAVATADELVGYLFFKTATSDEVSDSTLLQVEV